MILGDPAVRPGRCVVLLFGPPGAGKTTAAHQSGLRVFDRDDPGWLGERDFASALALLRSDSSARAVVIRSGATASARARSARLVASTHGFVMLAPLRVLEGRVRQRARPRVVGELASIRPWLARFERSDGVLDFPGWPVALGGDGSTLGTTSMEW